LIKSSLPAKGGFGDIFSLMIVTRAQLYKVAYGRFAVGAHNINNMEQCLGLFRGNDFHGPGKIFVQEYADFIAHKNEELGLAGKLDEVRASAKK